MGSAKYTVYDIETTGLSAACQCEIIEFAGIQYDENMNEIDRLHIYIKPYKKLPKKIIELTGITNEQLDGCENRFQALPKIRSFIGNTISVCHNANFDFGFISTMCLLQGLPVLKSYICTLKSYKALTGEKSGKLYMACEKFEIPLKNAHTAIADAEATAKVFAKLLELDKNNDKSKIFYKEYNENDLYILLMQNIADQNPNKKVRELLCAYPSEPKEYAKLNISMILNLFDAKYDPNTIAEHYNYNTCEVSLLFALWLNEKRLPKFIYLEEPAVTRQMKGMMTHSDCLSDLWMLHKKIYKDQPINRGIYTYYWLKNQKSINEELLVLGLSLLFDSKYPISKISENFPHLPASILSNSFCNYAINHKEDAREYISSTIVSKTELKAALKNKVCENINSEVVEKYPYLMNVLITCDLYNKGFFKLNFDENAG